MGLGTRELLCAVKILVKKSVRKRELTFQKNDEQNCSLYQLNISPTFLTTKGWNPAQSKSSTVDLTHLCKEIDYSGLTFENKTGMLKSYLDCDLHTVFRY